MKFKQFIQEKNHSSNKIINHIYDKMLPISPKFFEEVFAYKSAYCFIAIKPKRIDSLIKRQHKKNQLSTFTDWKDTNIFWGADDMLWKYDEEGELNTAYIAVLKGKVSFWGPNDLWTEYDSQGRRWINMVYYIDRYNDRYSTIFKKILKEIDKKFITNVYDDDLTDKQDFIKRYFDLKI